MPEETSAEDTTLRTGAHYLLRAGVALSGLLMAGGLIAASTGAPLGIEVIRAGVVALMLTPIAQVAYFVAASAWKGDLRFFLVSLSVLVLLGVGIFLGVKH